MSQYEWNKRILIVDDEKDIAKGYQDILVPRASEEIKSSRSRSSSPQAVVKKQFDVDVANTAEQAIDMIKKSIAENKPYTLGFFDVLLGPGKDGIELVKEVFALDANIYAVFVTAYQDRSVDSIRSYLEEKSIDRWDYLNKPLNEGELLQKARNYNALWNLQQEKKIKDIELNSLRKRIFDSDRSSSIAAISRSVTHEFGNVLMQIMGKADISRKKNPEDMKKALEVILEASVRANEILGRFKNASHAEESEEKSEVYIHEVLDKCIELMEFQIRNSKTKVEYIEQAVVRVPVNKTTIMQVFLNLMINAIHAMGDGGRIQLQVKKTEEFAEVTIADNGPGIPTEILDHVLVPFFTTKGSQGSGLGLAICKEIVEVEHGGEMKIENKKDSGLTVSIRIPLKDPMQEEQHESA